MSLSVRSNRPIADAWRILVAYRWRALVPALLVAGVGLAYAAFGPETWQASWAVQIRDEAIGSRDRLGKFATVDSMKTAQETIQQLAKSELVVAAALRAIGPPASFSGTEWPDATAIRDAQEAIAIESPRGTEFGKTELLYIRTKADSRERAIAFDEAICAETEHQLQALRRARAESLTNELDSRVVVARAELDQATERLGAIEAEVGGDLGELRLLNTAGAGESNLRHTLVGVKSELRAATLKRASHEKLLEMLQSAASDPTLLVAAPNQLLETLPTLRQLKDGIVATRLRFAEATSRMTEAHPLVKSIRVELDQLQAQIRGEIATATAGLQAELDLADIAIQSLDVQRIDLETRMTRVAGLRAKYGNLARETERQNELLSDAIRDLIDARSQYAAAETTSVLTFIGSPTTGGKALPPGRMTIAGIAVLAGLLAGLGCVVLTVPWRFVTDERESAEASIATDAAIERLAVESLVADDELLRLAETAPTHAAIEVAANADEATIAESAETLVIDASSNETIPVSQEPVSTKVGETIAERIESEPSEEDEIEIATLGVPVEEPPLMPETVRSRAHGVDLSNWASIPDLFADDPLAPWVRVESKSMEPANACPFVAEATSPESSEESASSAPSQPADPPVRRASNGAPYGPALRPVRLYPGMDAKRKLSLRQALVTLSKRRPGRS